MHDLTQHLEILAVREALEHISDATCGGRGKQWGLTGDVRDFEHVKLGELDKNGRDVVDTSAAGDVSGEVQSGCGNRGYPRPTRLRRVRQDRDLVNITLSEREACASHSAVTDVPVNSDLEDLRRVVSGAIQLCRCQPADVIVDIKVRHHLVDELDPRRRTPRAELRSNRNP